MLDLLYCHLLLSPRHEHIFTKNLKITFTKDSKYESFSSPYYLVINHKLQKVPFL